MTISVFDIILAVLVLGIISIGWYLAYNFAKYYKRKLDLVEYEININYDTTNISDELDAIIQGCIEEYNIVNIAFRSDINYINEELQIEIRKAISDEVSKRLSPAYIQKLGTFYSPSSIYDIIGHKIYLAVTAYVVQFNAGKPATP